MTYATYVECTRCGGAHSLSQCPWPAELFQQAVLAAEAAALDALLWGMGVTEISMDGTVRHVPISEWMKP